MTDYKDFSKRELEHLNNSIVLIASENYPSQDVLDACGSIFQLHYSEGFSGKRYYQGCGIVDEMEQECMDTCLELFNAKEEYLANVQPNSGASANMIVYNAVLQPEDRVLAMDVASGGHISHGIKGSFLDKYHTVKAYHVDDNGELDYDEIERMAVEFQPKLIIAGASNYPLEIDFRRFKEIADKVGAKLMCDIAHISILCAHGEHMSPVGLADFITFTTHKCLKGSRGGVILYKKEYDKAIKFSTIPSLFGGPLQNQIYGKLVCFKEALTDEAYKYTKQIKTNAQAMASALRMNNISIVTGRTENHLMTVDLRGFTISGKQLAVVLEECGIICNCNTVPNDPRSFMQTSGIRIGTPAITARGLKEEDVTTLTQAMADVINSYKTEDADKEEAKKKLSEVVDSLVEKYPLSNIYKEI